MTNTTSLICTTRHPHKLLDLGQAIGIDGGRFDPTSDSHPWITDKPPEVTIGWKCPAGLTVGI